MSAMEELGVPVRIRKKPNEVPEAIPFDVDEVHRAYDPEYARLRLLGGRRALGEYILPYDVVRSASSPEETLLEFLQSTYDAAANLGHWDRSALEMTQGDHAWTISKP